MNYKVRIDTSSYKPLRCSKKTWELGTINDYMKAIHNWKSTEHNLKEVLWRLLMFEGSSFVNAEYVGNTKEGSFGLSDEYCKWRDKKCNTIRYYDNLCEIERVQIPSGYGFMQGYFAPQDKVAELKKNGYVRVYFSELYDMRQYIRNMDGCYMEIWKSGIDYDATVNNYENEKKKRRTK